MSNGRVSFIAFFPATKAAEDKRTATEIAKSFAEKLGMGWRGILFIPGGKATVSLRKKLAEIGNERGFVVFASEASCDSQLVSQRILRSANGVFVSEHDTNHPVRGYAEINGLRLTNY
jgi:hypothetical protein